MKYRIFRTSDLDEKYCPCEGAVLENIEQNRCDLIEGEIVEIPVRLWTIEIEDLHEFCNKIGEKLVLFPDDYFGHNSILPTIEIYDFWRE